MKEDSKENENKECTIPVVMPRTCSTCAHKRGSKCMLSGYYTITERTYPSVCGRNFQGWKKRLGLIERIKFWLYGV